MSRPQDLEIKDSFLKRCLEHILSTGNLEMSLNELGAAVGSSGRMLVYHFGSKANLDVLLASQIEDLLRQELVTLSKMKDQGPFLLVNFWDHITSSPQCVRLLRLFHEIIYRTSLSAPLKSNFESETKTWISLLADFIGGDDRANASLMMIQGALLDFIMTSDGSRGRKAIETFSQCLALRTDAVR